MRWSFLYKVLFKFGFKSTIIETFTGLYNKPTARIKITSDLIEAFILERGTRQGGCTSSSTCPLKPLLLTLFIEPLSRWIRQRSDITGVTMPSGEQKMALFASDLLITYNLHRHSQN